MYSEKIIEVKKADLSKFALAGWEIIYVCTYLG